MRKRWSRRFAEKEEQKEALIPMPSYHKEYTIIKRLIQ